MILNDRQILQLAHKGMIRPYHEKQSSVDVISYGLSSFGYDMRLGFNFKIFTPSTGDLSVIDPKNFDERNVIDYAGSVCVIPPNSFVLGISIESFHIPENVVAICLGKSTYARCGLVVNVTPLEPGWVGNVTIEISNTTPLPAKVYGGEGIAQVLFFQGERPTVTYADRKGKYQGQTLVTLPKVDRSK